MDLNALCDEATGAATPHKPISPVQPGLPAIRVASKRLEELLNVQLPALLQSAVALEKSKTSVRRVDGRIIGTGEADFTKGNTLYTLNYKGKTFQLIDVPGIEGDESKYAHMVRQAVAKAHLVFYVNGTNKKPEKATAEKIRSTIHPSRDHDLLIQQRNYLKHFASAKAMFEFSQVKPVAQVLHAKLGTFREDIIESNKVKVRELLIENADVLQTALKEHQTFIARVTPEFEKCRVAINEAVQSFERLTAAGRKNLWSDFFNQLSERADEIVAEYFGDNDLIATKLKSAFKTRQDGMGARLREQFEEQVEVLQSSISQAMERLIQDVQRVKFQQRITFDEGSQKALYRSAELDMALGLKGWGSIAFSVGSYALTGAGIGSVFPGIGNLIGGAIGAMVGALVSILDFFTSKAKRIRKAQAQVQGKLDDVRYQVMDGLSNEMTTLMKPIRQEVEDTTLSQVNTIYASLTRPLDIMQQQIALMTHIKNQLEKMPHGTIQTIQR